MCTCTHVCECRCVCVCVCVGHTRHMPGRGVVGMMVEGGEEDVETLNFSQMGVRGICVLRDMYMNIERVEESYV